MSLATQDLLATQISRSFRRRLRGRGALVLDVDDTLLARPPLPGDSQAEDSGHEVAGLIRGLLANGMRVVLVTGHGWEQLRRRWIEPWLLPIGTEADRLLIYANRGATKIAPDGGALIEDRAYRLRHALAPEHRTPLLGLLSSLRERHSRDIERRVSWYRRRYPRFDFDQAPTVSVREEVVAFLRPLPSRAHATEERPPRAAGGADPRSRIAAYGRAELCRMGLAGRYELAESGRSTIEIMRGGISKRVAIEDTIRGLSATTGALAAPIEESLIYVGDEFYPGGNDRAVHASFPRCRCFSVSPTAKRGGHTEGVTELPRLIGESGPAAARSLLSFLLRTISEEPISLV